MTFKALLPFWKMRESEYAMYQKIPILVFQGTAAPQTLFAEKVL